MNTTDFPELAEKIAAIPYGLVVIDGPKGSGKSALLNLVEDKINEADGGLANQSCADFSAAAAQIVSLLHWQKRFDWLMRLVGFSTLAIEDIETTGENGKYLIEKCIDLALTGTRVIMTIDSSWEPEGKETMEFLRSKIHRDLKPLWVNIEPAFSRVG